MIVLDTNVLSEPMRPQPARAVEAWVAAQPSASLSTTTITQAEILYGLAPLPAGRRRSGLTRVANTVFDVDLAGRVLPFDSMAAREFATLATLAARCRQAGRPMAQADAQIARGAPLATRRR